MISRHDGVPPLLASAPLMEPVLIVVGSSNVKAVSVIYDRNDGGARPEVNYAGSMTSCKSCVKKIALPSCHLELSRALSITLMLQLWYRISASP